MSANDIKQIISEVAQAVIALVALAGVIYFQANHEAVPDLVTLILGACLLAIGVKIGLPLQAQSPAPSAPISEVTNHTQAQGVGL